MKSKVIVIVLMAALWIVNVDASPLDSLETVKHAARKAGREAAFNQGGEFVWGGLGIAAGFALTPWAAVAVPIIAGYWPSDPPDDLLKGLVNKDETYRREFVRSYKSSREVKRFFVGIMGLFCGVAGRIVYEGISAPPMAHPAMLTQ